MTGRAGDTPGRDKVLEAIRDLWSELGHAPTQEEIAGKTGASRYTVRCHLAALERAGRLRRTAGQRRTIVLLDDQAKAS